MKRPYDSTVARIAGNIAGELLRQAQADPDHVWTDDTVARDAVDLARAIVRRVMKTEDPE